MKPLRLAFVTPRFSEKGTVGGAETLIQHLARRAALAGHEVDLLTTCATNHFTWENDVPAGTQRVDGMQVHYFPVDENRDLAAFLGIQASISQGAPVSRAEEETWIRNSVNSRAMMDHLRGAEPRYDLLVAGPYLFGVPYHVAEAFPAKTVLIPCLHDEPFARLSIFRDMLHRVAGCLFNSETEQSLAVRLHGLPPQRDRVVGMGLTPFEADPRAFAARRGICAPYLLYSGRRELLKGTPLLTDYVDAFRRRTGRDVKLVMTGSGVIEAPDSLRPHLVDVGFVSEQEKHEAMAGALAFCHPSANESFGIVLLEAWLARAPALVSTSGDVLVAHCRASGAGLWFRNYPEFEAELLLLMDQPGLARALGERGRAYVLREYDWAAIDRKLFAALAAFAPRAAAGGGQP